MSTRSSYYNSTGPRDEQITHVAHAAATSTETIACFHSPTRALLSGVGWVPNAAVTGQATDYTNLNVINKGTDGSGSTEIGNVDFANLQNAAACDKLAIYAPAAGSELQMSEGTVISVQAEKVVNGLALPSGTLVFTFIPN